MFISNQTNVYPLKSPDQPQLNCFFLLKLYKHTINCCCRETHCGKKQGSTVTVCSTMDAVNGVVDCQRNENKSERVVWFKHDTGHVNMAFMDYDG